MTVEVSSREQGGRVKDIREMDWFLCEIYEYSKYNNSGGLIYVHEFALENVEDFKDRVQSTYNVVDVQPVAFIQKSITPDPYVLCL